METSKDDLSLALYLRPSTCLCTVADAAPIDLTRIEAALAKARAALLAEQCSAGHWVGDLSSSALSTATAVTALAVAGRALHGARSKVQGSRFKTQSNAGLAWLAAHANRDGGWGDTPLSLSNLSTTTLCWAAFGAVPGAEEQFPLVLSKAEDWIRRHAGGIEPGRLAPAIIARYGKDRTFSVPILTMCALAGRLGTGREAWRHVIPLPFELAALPHPWFAALRLPVVSYALPALIAMGQARHHHAPARNPLARLTRKLARQRTLRVLTRIQPSNGGFLEATPLTSFVVMSLAGSGEANHIVTQRGTDFLLASQRADGSWPIDTNLAIWLTTLAVNALAQPATRSPTFGAQIRSWLLTQQNRDEHLYTHAAPGGWAWTDLPGGVPDADDTSGALLALRNLGLLDHETRAAGAAGVRWLLDLQNRDGGIPTFCRGWGALPFDRSSADLTAHAIRAWTAWLDDVPGSLQTRMQRALREAVGFVIQSQRPDGSWVPLWFGNEFAPAEDNPTCGTARVVLALAELRRDQSNGGPAIERGAEPVVKCSGCGRAAVQPSAAKAARRLSDAAAQSLARGLSWLIHAQHPNGSWGGAPGVASSVEETALAVEALASAPVWKVPGVPEALQRGVAWLVERVESGEWTQAAPIGFYFAKLWYYDRLYPLIFTVGALMKSADVLAAAEGRSEIRPG
jgi:squalene-hopene/tetraprenyl-beta-curcumene cyclase